jgi:hypothetical protein
MSSSTQLYKIKMRIMYAIVYNNLLFLDMFEFSIFGIPSVKKCVMPSTVHWSTFQLCVDSVGFYVTFLLLYSNLMFVS